LTPISPDILLTIWLSPAFPVGAFAYSHGLEWAVEAGDVGDESTLTAWLRDLVEHGGARGDAIILAECWRAMRAKDFAALAAANDLALALSPSAERKLETAQQGRSFIDAIKAAWSAPAIEAASAQLTDEIAYPVAIAIACAAHEIPLARACEGFALGFAANLVSAGVRLGIIGQTQGQRVLAALTPALTALGAFAANSTLEDLGSASFRSDIASMKHETQYSRIFRS
jgi:urease accessory protein